MPRTAHAHDPATLLQLRHLAAVVRQSAGSLWLDVGDLVSAGWLGYRAAAARGVNHRGSMLRARGAMLDEIRVIAGHRLRGDDLMILSGDAVMHVAMQCAAEPAPFVSRLSAEERQRAARAIDALPSRRRDVVLRLMRGDDVPTIARSLRCTTNAVHVARTCAIQALARSAAA